MWLRVGGSWVDCGGGEIGMRVRSEEAECWDKILVAYRAVRGEREARRGECGSALAVRR